MVDTTTRRPGSLWKAGALAVVVSVVLNHFLQAGALALFEIPHDFPPLHGPGPVTFFSVIGALTGVGTLMLMHVVSAAAVVWAVERWS